MGLLDFDNLPVNTLAGADDGTLRAVAEGMEISPRFRRKFAATKAVSRMLSPFYRINERRYERMADDTAALPPVFILGHWRSGTTFVHNVLSCDERFGYCTTYQTVFPHLMLWGRPFFERCVSLFMPSHRPTDSMELGVHLPQEEEFALSNMTPCSYYRFWIFPKHMAEYREKYLLFNDISERQRDDFKFALRKLIRISLHCSGRKRFLSKNPPHTGRIRTLLEMYPDAKFVYLIRNPYTVFESTCSFFRNTLPSLQLQEISQEELRREILATYSALYDKYEAEKGLIPQGNLVEVRFEDFESSPAEAAGGIYRALSLDGFEQARPAMTLYLDGHRNFRKNRYEYAPETVRLVERHWERALHDWNYKL